ncbi:MAG: hypothetical protein ACTHJ1_05145 [Bordetella sp.]|uniref:hypothetical protein n=1 Tax=Bordetella sp. TaxID=28081 RepID=UPI003F7B4461
MKRLLLHSAVVLMALSLAACVGGSKPHFLIESDEAVVSSLKASGVKGSAQIIAARYNTYCAADGRPFDPRDEYECSLSRGYLAVALYLSGQYAQALPLLEPTEARARRLGTGEACTSLSLWKPEYHAYLLPRMIYLAAARSGNEQKARQWFAKGYICELLHDEKVGSDPNFRAEFIHEAKARFGKRGDVDARRFLKDIWPFWNASFMQIVRNSSLRDSERSAQLAALARNAQKFMHSYGYPVAYVEVFQAVEAQWTQGVSTYLQMGQ